MVRPIECHNLFRPLGLGRSLDGRMCAATHLSQVAEACLRETLVVLASRLHGDLRHAPSDALAVDPGQTSSTPRDDIMFVEECLARLSVGCCYESALGQTPPRWNLDIGLSWVG